MITLSLIALISGQALVNTVLQIIIIGLVCGLLWWLVGVLSLPEPFAKIARAIIAILAVLFLINVLLSLVGHPIISW